MAEDIIVTLLDGTKILKSEVPVGVLYINEKGMKVKKVVKEPAPKADDPIVTLLDGKKVLKSQVPVGEIYINEKGVKVKKVVKAVTPTPAKPQANSGSFFDNIKQKASETADSVKKKVSDIGGNIGDSATEFAASTIAKLLKGLNITPIKEGVEKFGKENNKDVSATINFLNKLIELQKNGK